MNKIRTPFLIIGLLFPAILILSCKSKGKNETTTMQEVQDSVHIDREYALEATMLGFFAKDGTRNPILKANKGDRVRITITNGEVMTHDIAMEKIGVISETLLEKGSSTSISFTALTNDTYY